MKSRLFILLATTATLLIVLFSGCESSRQAIIQTGKFPLFENDYKKAMEYLRRDSFQDFEKGELSFLTLRFWNRDNVKIAGQLAQLYVAWTEQLKNEVDFLRMRLVASEMAKREDDKKALYTLIDYRLAQLAEIEENARGLCNVLITYNASDYISHRVMADYYRIMGDRENMEQSLANVEAINPQSNGLIFIRGAAKMQFDRDYIGAIHLFDEAIKRDPKFIKALYFKGLSYSAMSSDKMAKAIMQEVMKMSPEHPGAKAFLSAEAYIDSLQELNRSLIKYTGSEKGGKPDEPQLVYWLAEWVADIPKVRYRIAAPTRTDAEIRLVVSLVADGEQVLSHKEKTLSMEANAFRTESQKLEIPAYDKSLTLDILIQLMMKKSGEESFQTVTVRRAPLPRNGKRD